MQASCGQGTVMSRGANHAAKESTAAWGAAWVATGPCPCLTTKSSTGLHRLKLCRSLTRISTLSNNKILERDKRADGVLTRSCCLSEYLERSKCQMSQWPTLAQDLRGLPKKVLNSQPLKVPFHWSSSSLETGCHAVSSTSLQHHPKHTKLTRHQLTKCVQFTITP